MINTSGSVSQFSPLFIGGQLGYSGNVINFHQDISILVRDLPRLVTDIDLIVVRRSGVDPTSTKEFPVRRANVLTALQWLQENNPLFRDITINQTNLDALPVDGHVDHLLRSVTSDFVVNPTAGPAVDQSEDIDAALPQNETFAIPDPQRLGDTAAIGKMIADLRVKDADVIPWPKISITPTNEFEVTISLLLRPRRVSYYLDLADPGVLGDGLSYSVSLGQCRPPSYTAISRETSRTGPAPSKIQRRPIRSPPAVPIFRLQLSPALAGYDSGFHLSQTNRSAVEDHDHR